MSLKGRIAEYHLPVNLYKLIINSVLPPPPGELTFTKISGLDEELETVELPDRTRVSGGQTKPVNFTIDMPMHHQIEQAFMEIWFNQCQEPVTRGYKKDAQLIYFPIGFNPNSRGGGLPRTVGLTGLFITKRKFPDLDMMNQGDMALVEYTMSADDLFPV